MGIKINCITIFTPQKKNQLEKSLMPIDVSFDIGMSFLAYSVFDSTTKTVVHIDCINLGIEEGQETNTEIVSSKLCQALCGITFKLGMGNLRHVIIEVQLAGWNKRVSKVNI